MNIIKLIVDMNVISDVISTHQKVITREDEYEFMTRDYSLNN